MATTNWGVDRSWRAAVDFSTCGQYRFVKAGSVAGEVALNTTAGGSVLGVLQNDPKPQEEAAVRSFGFTKVYANYNSGSTITWGQALISGSDGQACGATLTTPSGSHRALGVALETISDTGNNVLTEMQLMLALAQSV